MSIIRIYPSKSNTIASGIYEDYNSGQNAVSEIWCGGKTSAKNTISRLLLKFPLNAIQDRIDDGTIMSGNVKSYKLKMTNSIPRDAALENDLEFDNLGKVVSSSFDLITFPINKDWDEGRGYDLLKEDYAVRQKGNPQITGYSNWNYSKRGESWDEPGVFNNPTGNSFVNIYSGGTDYVDLLFFRSGNTSIENFDFSVTASTATSKDYLVISANSIDYAYNPLSGETLPGFYSGETKYKTIIVGKDYSLSSETFNFNITAVTGLSSNYVVDVSGSNINYTYNELSGTPTTLEYQTGVTTYSGFTGLSITMTGGNSVDLVGTGDTFTLPVTAFTAPQFIAYLPTTEQYANILSGNSDFQNLEIEIIGGSSGNTVIDSTFSFTADTLTKVINYWGTQHFDIGDEDLEIDITTLVESWLNGEQENNGVGVAYSREYELLSTDTRSVSSFFTEKTNTAYKPFLEVEYDQTIDDDRSFVTNNKENRLFLYTYANGEPINYYSASTVDIISPSGQKVITGLTANQFSKGVYYVDINLPNSKKGERYCDLWSGVTFNPGYDRQDFKQYFTVKDGFYSSMSKGSNDYTLTTYGLEGSSIVSNEENIRIFGDLRINYSQSSPEKDFKLSYRLIMNRQEEVIPWTVMNKVFNNHCEELYFDLDTSWLLNNQSYKIEFRIEELNSLRILPESIDFKIQKPFNNKNKIS